jgi:hypothetical protein
MAVSLTKYPFPEFPTVAERICTALGGWGVKAETDWVTDDYLQSVTLVAPVRVWTTVLESEHALRGYLTACREFRMCLDLEDDESSALMAFVGWADPSAAWKIFEFAEQYAGDSVRSDFEEFREEFERVERKVTVWIRVNHDSVRTSFTADWRPGFTHLCPDSLPGSLKGLSRLLDLDLDD